MQQHIQTTSIPQSKAHENCHNVKIASYYANYCYMTSKFNNILKTVVNNNPHFTGSFKSPYQTSIVTHLLAGSYASTCRWLRIYL